MKKSNYWVRQTLVAAIGVMPTLAAADTIVGRVVSVADGDTVTVLDAQNAQHKIRLQGIDAPEKKQAFGMRSKINLSGLVYGKQVRVEYDKRDRYRRILGKIMITTHAGEQDANLAQVASGHAWYLSLFQIAATRSK